MLAPTGLESVPHRSTYRFATSLRRIVALFAMLLPMAAAEPAFASVTATGDFAPNPLLPDEPVEIGIDSYGTLRIDGGTSFSSDDFRIGVHGDSFGVVTVTGAGTLWTTGGGEIAPEGFGRLEILEGAVVQTVGATNQVGTGNGYAHIVVDGPGSLLNVNAQFELAPYQGTAVLEIRNGGIVNVPTSYTRVGELGRVAFAGGLMRVEQFDNQGLIAGHGEINVTPNGHFSNSGRIEVRDNESLRITSSAFEGLDNNGELLVDGGKLEVQAGLQNDVNCCGPEGASISLRNAEFRAGTIGSANQWQLLNRGNLTTFGGENHLYGSIRNESNGVIAVSNQSAAVFHDHVENVSNATVAVSSGSSALFLEGLQMNGGTLLADIAGLEGYGHIEVVGGAQVFGLLQINLQNGFVPQLGDSFQLLSATNGVQGFLNVWPNSQLSEGLEWEVEFETNSVSLNVVAVPPPVLTGDYNLDGVVDAVDYTVWRNAVDSGDLAADGDNSGSVDGGDYDVWKANYGNTAPSSGAGGLSLAVPEPASLIALTLGIVALAAGSRRLANEV
jgi:T5SS/PEP-CTERM-associated repeat protein